MIFTLYRVAKVANFVAWSNAKVRMARILSWADQCGLNNIVMTTAWGTRTFIPYRAPPTIAARIAITSSVHMEDKGAATEEEEEAKGEGLLWSEGSVVVCGVDGSIDDVMIGISLQTSTVVIKRGDQDRNNLPKGEDESRYARREMTSLAE